MDVVQPGQRGQLKAEVLVAGSLLECGLSVELAGSLL